MNSWFTTLFTSPPAQPAAPQLAALVQGWPNAAAIARRGKILVCNEAFADLLQLRPNELVGMPWDFVLGLAAPCGAAPTRCVIAGRHGEVSAVSTGGDEFVTVRDVHDDDVERTTVVANARQDMLNMVVFGLVHDIRNALTGLMLDLETLPKLPAAEQAIVVTDCLAATTTMSDMLMDLDLKGISMAANEFEPSRSLRAALRLVRHKFPHDLVIDELIEPTPSLTGSAARLTQAVMNLLVNALDACREGTRPARIGVALRHAEPNVLIEVHDSGPGVPTALREAIPVTYFTTKGSDGSGLGLAITRRVASEFAGTLEIGDSPLGGALFTLRLTPAGDR